jgi:hypothetical protein
MSFTIKFCDVIENTISYVRKVYLFCHYFDGTGVGLGSNLGWETPSSPDFLTGTVNPGLVPVLLTEIE